MNDAEHLSDRDHWRAIADQLGLGPESESFSESIRQRPKNEQPERRRPDPAELEKVGSPPGTEGLQAPTEPIPDSDEVREEHAVASPAAASSPQDESAEEASPRRGRRRAPEKSKSGGRAEGSRSSRSRPVAEKEASASSKKQDRGRGRKKPSRVLSGEEAQPKLAATEQDIPEPVDSDDDEGYGNWTVPSWPELIASLYRPDR